MNPINLYSVPILILVILLAAGVALLRGGLRWNRAAIYGGLALALALTWYVVRPVQTPSEGLDDLRSQIGTGIPVLLEFQSPY